jgi:hypothetical protein
MTTGEFAVNRTTFESSEGSSMGLAPYLGGQQEWFWGVPGAFQALASPRSRAGIPAAPTMRSEHEQSRGYWATLQYLLLRRLGWTRPDRGLRWWYDSGKPIDDPTLQLVSQVWDGDGFGVDAYLAWLLEGQPRFDLTHAGAGSANWDHTGDPLSDSWLRWRREQESASQGLQGISLPFGGGWDPLHLTGHMGEQGQGDSAAHLIRTSKAEQRAMFVTDRMDAWYSGLLVRGESLPTSGIHSWKVDVYVKPVGFLGTYRKSFETGLWFAGRHRHHMVGQ